MEGFWSREETTIKEERMSSAPACGRCKLKNKKGEKRTKTGTRGRGEQGIAIVIDGYSIDDREQRSKLKSMLASVGLNMLRDCYLIPSTRCCTSVTKAKEGANQCRPYVHKLLKEFEPDIILTIGVSSLISVIGHKWKKGLGELDRWLGWLIPDHAYDCFICPLLSIENLLDSDRKHKMNTFMWKKYLKNAIDHIDDAFYEGFDFVDDIDSCVSILSEVEGRGRLKALLKKKNPIIAFDYEANGLKPHNNDKKIYSVGIAENPNECYAFTIDDEETKELLVSVLASRKIRKIGANLKYEEHWSRNKLGTRVRNWVFDTVLGAHIEDQREQITSVKFQACVRLGIYDYSEHITPLLKGTEKGGNAVNQIDKIPLKDLLKYNALDGLTEFRLALIISRSIGVEL